MYPQADGIDGAEAVLTAREVAVLLRISPKKVYSLGIPHVRLSDRRVRYLRSDVMAFLYRARRGL